MSDRAELIKRNLRLAMTVERQREDNAHLIDTLDMLVGTATLYLENRHDENTLSVLRVAVKVARQRLADIEAGR